MLPGKLKPPHPQPLSHGERGVKVTMSYYDSLETRDPAEREQDLMGKLARQLVHAREHSPYYGRWLADCDLSSITSREALAALPLTRKRDLIELRKQHPPFGGLNALSHRHARRVFASPGPIYELQGQDVDPWRMAFGDPAKPPRTYHQALHCALAGLMNKAQFAERRESNRGSPHVLMKRRFFASAPLLQHVLSIESAR
jgi:hypothetical protein